MLSRLFRPRPRPLPEPIDLGWTMKSIETAATTLVRDRGVLVMTIEHSPVRGVTPTMLDWWFRHIGGTMSYRGRTLTRYRAWHPLDHIDWSLAGSPGTVRVGSRFRIVEAFGRNGDYLIDSVELVEKLDETGILLTRSIAGERIFSLEHRWDAVAEGTRYRSRMQVGSHGVVGRLVFNRSIGPALMPDEMGRAWLRHNIEEVGNLEFFLPELYAAEAGR